MKIIDLSHEIRGGMQVVPGDPEPAVERHLIHEKDGCHVDRLVLGTHTGTHVDVPYHWLPDGKTLDQVYLARFIGRGVVVDVRRLPANASIGPAHLKAVLDGIVPGIFVLFHTGWDRYFGTDTYMDHPYLEAETIALLVDRQVGLVGIDAMSIDASRGSVFPAHDQFLGRDILIVENLCHLDQVCDVSGFFSFLPLKVAGTDGSPIRAVYMEME